MSGKPWTQVEDNALRRMWVEEGMSMTQIARSIGRTRGSVSSAIARLGMYGLGARMAGQTMPWDQKQKFASPLAQ